MSSYQGHGVSVDTSAANDIHGASWGSRHSLQPTVASFQQIPRFNKEVDQGPS